MTRMGTAVRVGDFVLVTGNSSAWETGRVVHILPNGWCVIGYGDRSTPPCLLRYGLETPVDPRYLVVLEPAEEM